MQSYRKMSNRSTNKRSGIGFALFNCTGDMGMNNFGYLNSSFYFISNFERTCKKEIMADVLLELNLHSPPAPKWPSKLLAEPPHPILSVRTLWMTPFLAHLAHNLQSLENYEKNFQLVFYLRVFTIIVHCRKSKCTFTKVSSQ